MTSDVASSTVRLDNEKPALTGTEASSTLKNGELQLDWQGVFKVSRDVTFAVYAGTAEGYGIVSRQKRQLADHYEDDCPHDQNMPVSNSFRSGMNLTLDNFPEYITDARAGIVDTRVTAFRLPLTGRGHGKLHLDMGGAAIIWKRSGDYWQTDNLQPICVDWQNRFYSSNDDVMQSVFLEPVKGDAKREIFALYDQTTGILPVTGTDNEAGIVKFEARTVMFGVCVLSSIFEDPHSGIQSVEVTVSSVPSSSDLPLTIVKGRQDVGHLVNVTNSAGLWSTDGLDIFIDETPPSVGVVMEMPNDGGATEINKTLSDRLHVKWEGFADNESGSAQ
nr:hypothetical protein BaRGS_027227 [Batillaria attramentaria]